MKVGDEVKHKKNKHLINGRIREISKSGLRARVVFLASENPTLVWAVNAYYRLDSLEGKDEET